MPFVVSSRGLCLTGQVSSHQTSSELLNTSSGHPVDTDTKKFNSLFHKNPYSIQNILQNIGIYRK